MGHMRGRIAAHGVSGPDLADVQRTVGVLEPDIPERLFSPTHIVSEFLDTYCSVPLRNGSYCMPWI